MFSNANIVYWTNKLKHILENVPFKEFWEHKYKQDKQGTVMWSRLIFRNTVRTAQWAGRLPYKWVRGK